MEIIAGVFVVLLMWAMLESIFNRSNGGGL